MKKSEDVSKLFAMFGEKDASRYREIYEADQNNATLDRWPVFQKVQLDPPQAKVQSASNPAQPASVGMPKEKGEDTALQSLFRRLERTDDTPPDNDEQPDSTTEEPAESIRSLFDRLSRL